MLSLVMHRSRLGLVLRFQLGPWGVCRTEWERKEEDVLRGIKVSLVLRSSSSFLFLISYLLQLPLPPLPLLLLFSNKPIPQTEGA